MILSKKKALKFYKEWALPRRVEDAEREEKILQETGVKKTVYRRVKPEEQDRGQEYPLFHSGMETFAHFGIGIGIYFAQSFTLIIMTFIGGCIMICSMYEFGKSDYSSETIHSRAPWTAACNTLMVNATEGCAHGHTQCEATYRGHCDLPYNSVVADLSMCIVMVLLILLSQFSEKRIEKQLDDSIQTIQDYSVQVLDPQPDADNPDEWFEYFSQFGKVRGVTITRKNNELHELVLRKHVYTCKIQETMRNQYNTNPAGAGGSSSSSGAGGGGNSSGGGGKNDNNGKNVEYQSVKEHIEERYNEISKQLDDAIQAEYPVGRVYVTFEHEADASYCLSSLELPDFQTNLDIQPDTIAKSYYFRHENVLNVIEPPEPDNIIWQNLQIPYLEKQMKRCFAFFIFVGVLIVCWYIIREVSVISTTVVGIIIGIIDSMLPTLFQFLADFGCPTSFSNQQKTIQIQLFLTRFFISVVIPYLQRSWNEFLDLEFIRQILITQLTTCFLSPILAYLDMTGLFQRHVLSYYFSDTQNEMNFQWMGTQYSLAEKYTNLSKVLCISFFYCLLTPVSLFLATIAFVLTFAIDNYLLLRRWKMQSMLDADIAIRLRQQAMFAVAAHMYISVFFIYSWPMDQVMWKSTGQDSGHFAIVDKQPWFAYWQLETQPWHSETQSSILPYYRGALSLIGFIALYSIVLQPISLYLFRIFCFMQYSEFTPSKYNSHMEAHITTKPVKECLPTKQPGVIDIEEESVSSDDTNHMTTKDAEDVSRQVKFSELPKTPLYFPIIIDLQYSQKYLCSCTKHLLPQHRPSTITSAFQFQTQEAVFSSVHTNHYDKDDLSCYVPINRQSSVLSIVAYYADHHPLQRKQEYLRQLAYSTALNNDERNRLTRILTPEERMRLRQLVQSTRKIDESESFSNSTKKDSLFAAPSQINQFLAKHVNPSKPQKSTINTSNTIKTANTKDQQKKASKMNTMQVMNSPMKWKELADMKTLQELQQTNMKYESIPLPRPVRGATSSSMTTILSSGFLTRQATVSTTNGSHLPIRGMEENTEYFQEEEDEDGNEWKKDSSIRGEATNRHRRDHQSKGHSLTTVGYWCSNYNRVAKPFSGVMVNMDNYINDFWYTYMHDDGVIARLLEDIELTESPNSQPQPQPQPQQPPSQTPQPPNPIDPQQPAVQASHTITSNTTHNSTHNTTHNTTNNIPPPAQHHQHQQQATPSSTTAANKEIEIIHQRAPFREVLKPSPRELPYLVVPSSTTSTTNGSALLTTTTPRIAVIQEESSPPKSKIPPSSTLSNEPVIAPPSIAPISAAFPLSIEPPPNTNMQEMNGNGIREFSDTPLPMISSPMITTPGGSKRKQVPLLRLPSPE